MHEALNNERMLEPKYRNRVQKVMMEMSGIDPLDNKAAESWINSNSQEAGMIMDEADNGHIRDLAMAGEYEAAAALVSKQMGKGIRFNLGEYYYKSKNIPEERQFKEGRRVVYGKGANGVELTGVIKTFVGKGKEAGFSENMVGIEVDNEELKRLGIKAISVRDLIELNPEGAIVSSATKEEADKFKGYPKAA